MQNLEQAFITEDQSSQTIGKVVDINITQMLMAITKHSGRVLGSMLAGLMNSKLPLCASPSPVPVTTIPMRTSVAQPITLCS